MCVVVVKGRRWRDEWNKNECKLMDVLWMFYRWMKYRWNMDVKLMDEVWIKFGWYYDEVWMRFGWINRGFGIIFKFLLWWECCSGFGRIDYFGGVNLFFLFWILVFDV